MKIPPPLRQVGEYTLGKTIGRGSMGKVRIATSNNIQYGVKIVKRPLPFDSPTDTDILVEYSNFISDDLITQTEVQGAEHLDERRIIREMAITMLLDHPFIVTVHKVFVSNHYYYIIMDYVNGTHLLDFIISHGKLKEKLAQTLLTQLISAIGTTS